jgi:hypothetical protein
MQETAETRREMHRGAREEEKRSFRKNGMTKNSNKVKIKMPYKLRKSRNQNLYWVVNLDNGHKYSKHTIEKNVAQRQMNLLRGIEHGWSPKSRSPKRSRSPKNQTRPKSPRFQNNRSPRTSPRMSPNIFIGSKGGKYVTSQNGEKIYVPHNSTWKKEGLRWRLHLKDGKTMLLPTLR